MAVNPEEIKTVRVKNPTGFYAAGITWVLYALIFPLVRWQDYCIAAALSAAVYFTVRFFAKTHAETVRIRVQAKEYKTGDSYADEMLTGADAALARLHAARLDVADAGVAQELLRAENAAHRVMALLEEHPEKVQTVRRFLTYYLPTAAKLIESYNEMEKTGVAGENIREASGRIEKTVTVLADSFEKQVDKLMHDEALDISTDITVLEQMLAGDDLLRREPQAEKPADGPELRL